MRRFDFSENERKGILTLCFTYAGSMAWALGGSVWAILGTLALIFLVSRSGVFPPTSVLPTSGSMPHPQDSTFRSEAPDSAPMVAPLPPEGRIEIQPSGRFPVLENLEATVSRAASAADVESCVLALFKFKKTAERVKGQNYGDDLRSEIELIVNSHFQGLIEDYLEGRALASGETGERADFALADAVMRLATRLKEISGEQNTRHVNELEKRGNYLRGRHPVEGDDPFRSGS